MAKQTRKTKKTETPEQKLSRWLAGAVASGLSYDGLLKAGWEAGANGFFEITGSDGIKMNYERFDLEDGRYVVVEWDVHGNVGVL